MNKLLFPFLACIIISQQTVIAMDIFEASVGGDVPRVAELIANGIDVNQRRGNNLCTTPFFYALISNQTNVASFLLKNGVDVNETDRHGRTYLHYMVTYDNIESAQFLLEHGANPNQENNLGNTPLHSASMVNAANIARLLLEHGANPNHKDRLGYTPLGLAIGLHQEVVDVLNQWQQAVQRCTKARLALMLVDCHRKDPNNALRNFDNGILRTIAQHLRPQDYYKDQEQKPKSWCSIC